MANGWAEFREQIRQLQEAHQLDPKVVWTAFVQRSKASPLAPWLVPLTQFGQALPAANRSTFAFVVATLISPLEWPPEWEAVRPRVIEALEALLRAMDSSQPGSFPSLLALEQEEALAHATGYAVLQSTLNLLRTPPCRRDQLRFVARLCNIGQTTCQQAYRRALLRLSGTPMPGPLLDSRTRYVVAFEHYALAARALNSAVGAVLFEGLDARLELPRV